MGIVTQTEFNRLLLLGGAGLFFVFIMGYYLGTVTHRAILVEYIERESFAEQVTKALTYLRDKEGYLKGQEK